MDDISCCNTCVSRASVSVALTHLPHVSSQEMHMPLTIDVTVSRVCMTVPGGGTKP